LGDVGVHKVVFRVRRLGSVQIKTSASAEVVAEGNAKELNVRSD